MSRSYCSKQSKEIESNLEQKKFNSNGNERKKERKKKKLKIIDKPVKYISKESKTEIRNLVLTSTLMYIHVKQNDKKKSAKHKRKEMK